MYIKFYSISTLCKPLNYFSFYFLHQILYHSEFSEGNRNGFNLGIYEIKQLSVKLKLEMTVHKSKVY